MFIFETSQAIANKSDVSIVTHHSLRLTFYINKGTPPPSKDLLQSLKKLMKRFENSG